MTVHTGSGKQASSNPLQVQRRQQIGVGHAKIHPLDQARGFKADIERSLNVNNFTRALTIAKKAIQCVDSSIKQSSHDVEREVLQAFHVEFVRYVQCIIPSREYDLKRKKEKQLREEKDAEERLRQQQSQAELMSGRMSTLDSLSVYCMVEPDDCSSMYPPMPVATSLETDHVTVHNTTVASMSTASVTSTTSSSARYPNIHKSVVPDAEYDGSKASVASTNHLSKIPAGSLTSLNYPNHRHTYDTHLHAHMQQQYRMGASVASNNGSHPSIRPNLAVGMNDPLQFCSIDSTSSVAVVAGLHCSFYDSFASSFSISQHNQNNANQQLGLPGVQMNVKGNPFQNNLGVSNQFQLYNNHYHHPLHPSVSPNSLMLSQNYNTNAYHPNLTAQSACFKFPQVPEKNERESSLEDLNGQK